MKKFTITAPIGGHVSAEIKASSRAEALQKFYDNWTKCLGEDYSEEDDFYTIESIEILDWEMDIDED
ncbi:hypothetical protein N8Z24_00595 [bacterium]|nr:hypothetical protein [bacterium]